MAPATCWIYQKEKEIFAVISEKYEDEMDQRSKSHTLTLTDLLAGSAASLDCCNENLIKKKSLTRGKISFRNNAHAGVLRMNGEMLIPF